MRTIRTAALSRHTAPGFVLMSGLELMALRKLQWLARALFMELLALADHTTGAGRTSWAVLSALLDFDAAPQANTVARPTVKRLRTAMAELESAGLVRLDRLKNEKTQALIFRVKSRAGISSPKDMRGREQGREKEPRPPREKATKTANAGQDAGQRVQEPISYPLSPSLSTGAGREKAMHVLAAMKPPRGRTRAPQGA